MGKVEVRAGATPIEPEVSGLLAFYLSMNATERRTFWSSTHAP
ncbi:hypothetical protein [Burkholderia cenocepacia]|nr:hypothetical protein [Burkholderia cenocepacia]